jgi:hypothetical protein
MAKLAPVPTRRGDVLILRATVPVVQYSLATVDGQGYFGSGYNALDVAGFAEAVKQAKRLVWPGRHIYC